MRKKDLKMDWRLRWDAIAVELKNNRCITITKPLVEPSKEDLKEREKLARSQLTWDD